MTIKVLIADDHGVLRAGLRALLEDEADFQVVAEAADGGEALRLALEIQPDIVLLDIGMSKLNGIQVARRLREARARTRALMLTLHEDESLLRQSIESGAAGYVVKRAVAEELVGALRAVARGEMYVHPAMMRALLRGIAPADGNESSSPESLTPREIEVLKLVARGDTNQQIAQTLGISVRTVEGHHANIAGKLGFTSPIQWVRYALEHGWVD